MVYVIHVSHLFVLPHYLELVGWIERSLQPKLSRNLNFESQTCNNRILDQQAVILRCCEPCPMAQSMNGPQDVALLSVSPKIMRFRGMLSVKVRRCEQSKRNNGQRKFRNLTSDYTESCCWRSVNQEMWSRRCDTAEMWDMRIWRVGSARNAVFYHSFVASPARKVRS